MPKAALEELGPTLTGGLSDHLSERDGISKAAARKRIERATSNGDIRILQTFNFAKNQSLAFLPKHAGTRLYHERLFDALTEAKSVLRLPLAAMRARGGSIPDALFATISGCPINSAQRQDSVKVKGKLIELGFLHQEDTVLHLSPDQRKRMTPAQLSARLTVEDALLMTFAEWMKRQRLIGNQMSFRFDDEPPQSGYHQWDFVAPSYVAPLASRVKGQAKHGYVVADVIYGRVTQNEVQYFIEKCNNIRVHQNNRPFLAFLIADWFEQDALNLAQANGVIFTTPKNLFGRIFSEALNELSHLLELKETQIEEQATRMSELLVKLQNVSFVEKISENMRGKLFEMLVGHCYVKQYGGTVLHGRLFKDSNPPHKKWDCDVLQVTLGSYLRACECKGHRAATTVTLEDVKKWYCTIVPVIRGYHTLQDYPSQEFSFWTSGKFDDDARDWMTQQAVSCRQYTVSFKSGKELAALIQKIGDPTMKDVYKRWFMPILVDKVRQSA